MSLLRSDLVVTGNSTEKKLPIKTFSTFVFVLPSIFPLEF